MPSLEEIMGTEYREDMTAEDVNSFFKNKILSTGEYESKSKVDAERKANAQKMQELQNKVQGSMSEEELRNAEVEALKAEIESMKASEKASKLETSRLKALGTLAESTILVGITNDDKDYKKFLDNISDEDSSKTESISKYVNKLIKDAYEKGKAESTKKNLGNMGNQFVGGSSDKEVSKDIELVKEMQASKPQAKKNTKSNFI